MNGGITTDDRCPICGESFQHQENKGLFCPSHPKITPQTFRVWFKHEGKRTQRRFKEYRVAFKFLTGLRSRVDEGDFDARDFRRDKPLSFDRLASLWLDLKKTEIKSRSWNNLHNYIMRAVEAWGVRNIKTITVGDIEVFLKIDLVKDELSDKSRANARSVLNEFWNWLKVGGILRTDQIPHIPSISFDLGWRKTTSKSVQLLILNEIKQISWHINPKIWLGIRWLTVYIGLRPDDLLRIKEEDIDLDQGLLWIKRPTKRRRPKEIPLLAKDLDFVRDIRKHAPPLPHLYFFRHDKGHGGATPGAVFGPKYLYKWWIRACERLGIKDVDMYGGTRHTSARALKRTPEEVKRGMVLETNKAFDRYLVWEHEKVRQIYEEADAQEETGRVVPFRKE